MKLGGFAELLLVEQANRSNTEKRPRQLVVVGIAIGQAIIVDEYLELTLAQRGSVQMRKIIYCRPGSVHGRLVVEVDLAEKARITGDRARQRGQISKERHS